LVNCSVKDSLHSIELCHVLSAPIRFSILLIRGKGFHSECLAWVILARWVKSFDFLSALSMSWPESGEPN